MTIDEAITHAVRKLSDRGVPNARLDAELLLSHILQKDRAWLFTHAADRLDTVSEKHFQELIHRRAGREPLQYIVGSQEFWGLEFKVTRDVLIPRPETELVVESAMNVLKSIANPTVIDLCTGSGCIAVSIGKQFDTARIFATDMSDRALGIARENARKHGVMDRIRFLEGDLFQPMEELDLIDKVHLITANPPYIPSGDLPSLQPEVRDHEPAMALTAGADGTEIQKRIIAGAARFLLKNGSLIMEMGIGQAETLGRIIDESEHYGKREILQDLAGIDRVIIGTRK